MKLMLINKDHPLPENYKPCLTDLMEGYQLERKTACAMKEMICAALKDGIHLRIFSAYRSISYQQGLFNEDIQRYMKQGMSYEDAFNKTAQSIAVPGQSEHNAGLAADISTMDWKGEINPEFENTEELKRQIEQDIQETLQKCRKITLEMCRKEKIGMKIMGRVLRLFAPLM